MAKRKPIAVEPDSEVAMFLRQFDDGPASITSEGITYWIEREIDNPFAGYDPATVLAAMKKVVGASVNETKKKSSKDPPPPWGSR